MSIITKPSIVKGTPAQFTLNKVQLLANSVVAADSYFSDSQNWYRVNLVYKSTVGGQYEIVEFDATQSSPTGNFLISEKARDSFEILKIKIIDFDGGFLEIPRSSLTSADFDIAVGGSIAPSLLLHFNKSFIDSSVTGKLLTKVGSPVIQTSVKKFGEGSLQCPTNSDYVTISATKSELLGSNDFTIEGWIYPTQNNGGYGDRFLTFHTGSNDSAGMVFYTYNGKINFNLTSASAPTQKYVTAGSVNANLNQWNHYAFVKSGNNLLFFVNGQQSFSGDFTNTNIDFTNIWIGLSPLVGGVFQGFRGYIDEIRISKSAVYTTSFTPSESEFTPVEPTVSALFSVTDFVGHWKADSINLSDGSVLTQWQSENNSTKAGFVAPTVQVSGTPKVYTRDGKKFVHINKTPNDGETSFTGDGGFDTGLTFNSSSFTIIVVYDGIINPQGSYSDRKSRTILGSNNFLIGEYGVGDPNMHNIYNGNSFLTSKTVSGITLTSLVVNSSLNKTNGWIQGESINSSEVLASYPGKVIIGRHSSGLYNSEASGAIYELIVYDRALSSQERRSIEEYLANKYALTLAPAV